MTIQVNGLLGGETVIEGFRITGNPFGNSAVNAREFATAGELTFRDCVFEDLDGGGVTGAIRAVRASLRFENCAFRRCTGSIGGIHFDEGNLTILDTVFEECSAIAEGSGAVQASNPATQNPFRSARIERCTFRDNAAGNAAGLAVGNFRGGALVQDCVFDNNVAQNSAGALFFGGYGSYVVRRNLFIDSVADGSGTARLAGAIWAANEFVIEENTFVGSHQGSEMYGGSAILVEGTSSKSSVIRRNIIADCTGAAAIGMFSGTIETECNVFWNNAEGEGIPLDPTDLVADPQFCEPKLGDYTVASTSPCLPENNPGCDESIGALGVGCGARVRRTDELGPDQGDVPTERGVRRCAT